MTPRIGFYDPYLRTAGGGEKYLLSIAEEVASGPFVRMLLMSPEPPDAEALRRLRVNLDSSSYEWVRTREPWVTARTPGLDLFVALHNHVPPLSLARRSVAVIQFPSRHRNPSGMHRLADDARIRSYDEWLCYSSFVQTHLQQRLGVKATVLPPPIDLPDRLSDDKDPAILAVGRFFPAERGWHNKKHDVLIDAFRELLQLLPERAWRLHLAGGSKDDEPARRYLGELNARSQGVPVDFHVNVDAETLAGLYDRSTLFWHAAGFGETRPERMEHFGMTTVEAMAHGCVPLVPPLGGQTEIVEDGLNGFYWRSRDELVRRSASLAADPTACRTIGHVARESVARFGRERFAAALRGTAFGETIAR